MVRLPGDGWKESLQNYQDQKDDLYAGRRPRGRDEGGVTVADVCDRYLSVKDDDRQAGEITRRTFDEYKLTTDMLVSAFGKNRLVTDLDSRDFEELRADMARRWGPVRLGNMIQRVRTVLKYAYDAGMIERTVRTGSQFKKPKASVLRRHRANMRHVVGGRAAQADKEAASTSGVGRFETEIVSDRRNLRC
jgi:hypothetical protein